MIEYKCYLIRNFIENMKVDNVANLLDTIENKVSEKTKFNILVQTTNVVKAACLLIEVLELVAVKFDQFAVGCKTIRKKISTLTQAYINKIEHIAEMRFLLLEKDFENRDSLDIISKY